MEGVNRLEREARSRVYLSKCTSGDLFSIECRILDSFNGGKPLTDEELINYDVMIKSLKDSTYLRCGINPEIKETFKTTFSGKRYLKTFRNGYRF